MSPEQATEKLLEVAAKRGNINDVPALMDAGANVNAKDQWQRTPLHWAVAYGRDDLSRLLIAHGADVNATEEWGQTPLHFAAENGRTDIARLLIQNGANVNARTKGRVTALDLALEYRHDEIAAMLKIVVESRLKQAKKPIEPC